MYIGRVRVHGFRSLCDIDVHLSGYTSLIGKNDSGKSTFLHALRLLFDPETTPTADDLCKIEEPDGECYIEAELHGNEIPDRLQVNGRIRIRRLLRAPYTWQFWGQIPRLPILQTMLEGHLTRSAYQADPELTPDMHAVVDATLNERTPSGRVPVTTWQEAFNRLHTARLVEYEPGWCTLDPQMLGGLVQVVILNAYARGEEEVADTSRSVFGRVGGLLAREAIRRHQGLTTAIDTLKREIDDLCVQDEHGTWKVEGLNQIDALLTEEIQRFDDGVRPHSRLLPPRVPTFDFGIQVEIADAWVTGLEKMGHGQRRSVVYAMLRALRRQKELRRAQNGGDPPSSLPLHLFLVEEPELYLHPQAERRRMQELQELAELPDVQVVLCTHSAFFVDLRQYRGILRFERPGRRLTRIHGWTGEDLSQDDRRMLDTAYFFDPTRAAMLFADLVILVEGQTEKVTVPPLAERLGLPTANVEVVDCGGNGNIPIYQRVLEELKIPYVAWLDSREKQEVRKAQAVRTPEIGRIVLTDGNWERIAELSKGGDKASLSLQFEFRPRVGNASALRPLTGCPRAAAR